MSAAPDPLDPYAPPRAALDQGPPALASWRLLPGEAYPLRVRRPFSTRRRLELLRRDGGLVLALEVRRRLFRTELGLEWVSGAQSSLTSGSRGMFSEEVYHLARGEEIEAEFEAETRGCLGLLGQPRWTARSPGRQLWIRPRWFARPAPEWRDAAGRPLGQRVRLELLDVRDEVLWVATGGWLAFGRLRVVRLQAPPDPAWEALALAGLITALASRYLLRA